MDAVALLAEARAAGLEVRAEGDRLIIRGPRRAEAVARRLLDAKPVLMPVLTRSARRARRRPLWYAFPWPDELSGLGRRRVLPFDLCVSCGAGSWVAYGATPLCLGCARRRGGEVPL